MNQTPKPMLAAGLALLFLSAATMSQELLDPDEAFRFSARALDPSTIEVAYLIAPGYYLYRKNFKLELGAPAGARLGEPRFPAGHMKNDPIFGEVEIYRDEVKIRLPVALPAGAREVTLLAGSQGCSDVGICYLPQMQELKVSMTDFGEKSLSSPLDRLNPPTEYSTPAGRPEADILKALRNPRRGAQ
jgi:thiol:disulfide interchange protein DsbD